MKDDVFDSMVAGLEDAIAHAKGDGSRGRTHEVPVVDVAQVRPRLNLTQAQFARIFGVPLATLRNWEQHRREPEGPARALLVVIDREPEAVVRALRLTDALPAG